MLKLRPKHLNCGTLQGNNTNGRSFGWTTRGIPIVWKHINNMATRDQNEARSRTNQVLVSLHKTGTLWPHVVENSRFTRRLSMNKLLPHRFPRCILCCCAWLVGNQLGCCRFIYDWLRAGQNWASLRDFRAWCIRNWFSFCVIISNKYVYIYIYNPDFHEE